MLQQALCAGKKLIFLLKDQMSGAMHLKGALEYHWATSKKQIANNTRKIRNENSYRNNLMIFLQMKVFSVLLLFHQVEDIKSFRIILHKNNVEKLMDFFCGRIK